MKDLIKDQKELLEYYKKRLQAIKEEMDDLCTLIKSNKQSSSLEEIKREYQKLQEEKEFFEANLQRTFDNNVTNTSHNMKR